MSEWNYRITRHIAERIKLRSLTNKAVFVVYMSDEEKAAVGMEKRFVMAKTITHQGEIVAENVVLKGKIEVKRKME